MKTKTLADFQIWISVPLKTDTKRCTNNSLLSHDKLTQNLYNTFDFDEKLTQNFAQIRMWYHVSEDFLRLHFAVDQFQGMVCKTEEYKNIESKNIELKIWR